MSGYFVRIGPNEVSVSHPDAVRQLLHAQIAKGPWYAILSLPDYRYVNQMSELDPQQHIRKQRNIASGYALSNIIKHEPHFDTVLRLLTTRLNEFCRSGQPVELDRWFTFFAFDAVGEVIFSKSFGFLEQGKDVRDAIANQRLLAPYAAVMGYYAWFHNLTLGNPLLSRLGIQPSSHVFDTCIAAIDARKENPAKRNDMMQKWLDTRAKYPDRMEEVEIFSTAVGTLGAGGDTVSATIQALFYFLIRHPQYMARVQEELDAAQAREELSPIVQYSEAQKLPFLQACIKETYRLHTAVGLGLPRVAPRGGITIAGRHFAQGTVLSINPWVIHRNPDLFGEDCDSFNPDRWLQKQAGRMDAFLIHWGAGYNACPGRNFAQFEISKLAATLFRDYDIEQVDPNQEWTWHNHFICVPPSPLASLSNDGTVRIWDPTTGRRVATFEGHSESVILIPGRGSYHVHASLLNLLATAIWVWLQ
ncbi:hypothetical protein N7471_013508 [Penicillium samsonianum]|uniref:uncharacterized protein n=1 Tax=Penicillium samsonianum TaxID=1882272 RepID=UPI002546E4D4|nr:uncharacterized protein N7471_013508 [Penicillium samsonianum]KAJ6118888.1 hypothetical protein N7471_013508 [Penicillium samsonianum]